MRPDHASEVSEVGRLATNRARRTWLPWVILTVVFLALSGILSIRYMQTHLALSPFDEYQYVDAVDKAREGIVVRDGHKIGDYGRELIACRGYGTAPETTQTMGTCGMDQIPDSEVPYYGYSSAGVHSPVYFFTTAWMSWPLEKAFNLEPITAYRMTSAIWLGLGMVAFAYFLRRLGNGWGMTVAIPILVASLPVFRATNSYISPDALNLLFGSGIFLSGYLYARREWTVWPLIVISAIASAVKFQNIFAVVAVILFLLWYKIAPGDSRDRDNSPGWAGIALTLAVPAVVAGGWMYLRKKLELPTPDYQMDPPADLNWRSVWYTADDTLKIILAGTDGTGTTSPPSIFPSIALWLFLAAMIAAAFFEASNPVVERRMAQSGLVSLVGIAPATIISFALVFNAQVAMQFRYAMVLIPLLAAFLGTRLVRKPVQVLFYLFTAAAYLFALLALHAN